ncbi:AAA domain-containing protein [Poseidonibacter ostreae]|jgi:superfamily I DNA and/or RNA helicase|uniref:AAA family ATPase n=1 Tax=Poseidonibacter ostreae TaxID=2654171 RepID=A0A6L4WSP8_9BACT|nr:AAA domain-containing protein [Poseidonibacter ostreae]KAB7887143.1 AAA family ATPase [Poseidonibacter ostreae]KAB7888649.1 AAA family ATPase [Poseidonibacter ostreae]KAB7892304.1 AAA family ATPase [Poseidonibacter ostreae]
MKLHGNLIFINGLNKTDEIESISSLEEEKVKIKFYKNNTVYSYTRRNVTIEKNILNNKNASNVLEYLKRLAQNIDTENDFLFNQYEKMTQLSEKSALSKYLNQAKIDSFENKSPIIFPFGFNLSQEFAISKALTNQVSIIEGPPGTGKTQTILNIIANVSMQNKTVAIVSNNNAATMNVFDKLTKYDLSFISAFLGNNKNKDEFFANQNLTYPQFDELNNSNITFEDLEKEVIKDTHSLKEMLSAQNEVALLKQEFEELELEKKYFSEFYEKREIKAKKYANLEKFDYSKILSLWADFEYLQTRNKKISFFFKLKNIFKYGILSFSFYNYSIDTIIALLQSTFYIVKEKALKKQITILEKKLQEFNFETNMDLHSKKSMHLFKSYLSKRYKLSNKRKRFDKDILWKDFKTFIEEYPIILSTTHSLRNSTGKGFLYDYLIIDESSQVDIVAGSLALSCAKNVVIVGDLKQLPHIVSSETSVIINSIYNKYKLNPFYHYNNNLLLSITNILKDAPKTLLKEHYRCHPKIIGFCNKKFYNNELIILTKARIENDIPLVLYNTVVGNHARGTYNQRQIDVITNEILPYIGNNNVGIVSPFRKQVNELIKEVNKNSGIEVDTVHKFQGREKNTIIITTVVDGKNEFADDLNLLNVAISRAIDKLYVVLSDNEENKNMKDLIDYIKYNNFDIKESRIYSIFDLLYKNYAPYLNNYLEKMKHVSAYKSENLMNIVIENILKKIEFQHLRFVLNISLNRIIKDTSLLNEEELTFVKNPWSHIDFIIYSTITKLPILAIEVDGYAFHENNSKQLKRDKIKNCILRKSNIPLIRFPTNGSQEEEKLFKLLKELV